MSKISIGSKINPTPAISVVIPNYNTERYIAQTLESVFSQTFADLEVIVINDASPGAGDLPQILAPYQDRIVFIDNAENRGTSYTRNRGVDSAKASVISFLDADDIWEPTFLEETFSFLSSNTFDLAYADADAFFDHPSAPHIDYRKMNPPQGLLTRERLIAGRCHILPSGTLIKKKVFQAVGGFDENVSRTEDFDLWMRLLFAGAKIGYLRKLLFHFRIRPDSGSGDSIVRLERCSLQWKLLQTKLPFTEAENAIVERHIKTQEAAVVRAKGRMHLESGDWKESRRMFREALRTASELGLPLFHRAKMRLVVSMLSVWPSALRFLFRQFRGNEIDFMPKGSL